VAPTSDKALPRRGPELEAGARGIQRPLAASKIDAPQSILWAAPAARHSSQVAMSRAILRRARARSRRRSTAGWWHRSCWFRAVPMPTATRWAGRTLMDVPVPERGTR